MKRFVALVVVLASVAVINSGCEKAKTTNASGTKSITLTKPGNVTLKQGDTSSLKVSISRKGFNEPVEVKFDGLPEGVSIEETDRAIAKDKDSTTFNLKAKADAPVVTDKAVTVSVTGGDLTSKETINVSVKAK